MQDEKELAAERESTLARIKEVWEKDDKDYDELISVLVSSAKKRGLHRTILNAVVSLAMEYLEQLPNREVEEKFVTKLREVTEGKITVEREQAEMTLRLARIKEEQGDISTAAGIIQEVQVETFGSLENRKKTEFILEQMRLCLLDKDFLKVFIISEKINTNVFEDADFEDLKIKYYRLLIAYYASTSEYFRIYECYKELLKTPSIKDIDTQRKEFLSISCWILVLAKRAPEQISEIHLLMENKDLEELLPEIRRLLVLFTKSIVISWAEVEQRFKMLWNEYEELQKLGKWDDMHDRVVEFNIFVIAKHFSTITMSRLAQLLELDVDVAEGYLRRMVTEFALYLKIDQIAGTVSFSRPSTPEDYLNEWTGKIKDSLSYVQDLIYNSSS